MIKRPILVGKHGQKAKVSSVGAPQRGIAGSSSAALGQRDTQYSFFMTVIVSVLIVFMVVPEGFDYQAVKDGIVPTSGSAVSRLIWIGLFAFSLSIVVARLRQARELWRLTNPYLFAFVILALASILWSIEPSITIRRMIRVFTIIAVSFAFALVAWRDDRFVLLVGGVLVALMFGSIGFVIRNPTLAIEQVEQAELIGAWHGLATQKNGLGSLASFATLIWFYAFMARKGSRPISVIFTITSFYCLVKSRSSTNLMSTIFSMTLLLMLIQTPQGLKRYMPYLIGGFVSIILIYSLAVLNLVPGLGFILKPIVMVTGKDLTFSGRVQIWEVVREHIALNPFLGSGYGAYWTGLANSPSIVMQIRLSFYPGQSHNGYIEVVNDLGMVGGFVLLGYLVFYLRQSIRLFLINRVQGTLFLVLLFQQLVSNLSEARWLSVVSVDFVIMSLATMALSRTLLESERQMRMSNMLNRQPETNQQPKVRSPFSRRSS